MENTDLNRVSQTNSNGINHVPEGDANSFDPLNKAPQPPTLQDVKNMASAEFTSLKEAASGLLKTIPKGLVAYVGAPPPTGKNPGAWGKLLGKAMGKAISDAGKGTLAIGKSAVGTTGRAGSFVVKEARDYAWVGKTLAVNEGKTMSKKAKKEAMLGIGKGLQLAAKNLYKLSDWVRPENKESLSPMPPGLAGKPLPRPPQRNDDAELSPMNHIAPVPGYTPPPIPSETAPPSQVVIPTPPPT